MTKESSQAIAARSKSWLTAALLALLQEQRYDEIRITDIIARADLTRQTFYRHFRSKDAVLQQHIADLYAALIAEVYQLEDRTFFTVMRHYFDFWLRQRPLLDSLIRSGYPYDPLSCAEPYVQRLFSCATFQLRYGVTPTPAAETFISGGLAALKTDWMRGGYNESPAQLAATICELLGIPSS